METQSHQTGPLPWLPETAPELGTWIENRRFLQTKSRERQKGLGKKTSNFLVSLGVCLLFLMSEFNYDLKVFNQKLIKIKLVPVLKTNPDGKQTCHNWTPQHPSTVQQPADKPSETRNDVFKGRKISTKPCILFRNPCKIWHLQRIGQQVLSEVLNQKFKSRKVNSWSHQKCCFMTSNAKFKYPHSL